MIDTTATLHINWLYYTYTNVILGCFMTAKVYPMR